MQIVKCPRCTMSDDIVSVGVHLNDFHSWSGQQVLDWMRYQEESKIN